MKSLYWFRQDLRLTDNPALYKAIQSDQVIAIYINDDNFPIGGASKLWLHHSLEKLNGALNNKLNIFDGNPAKIVKKLVSENNISSVYWNRCYDKYSINRDSKIKQWLYDNRIDVKTYNGSLLIEPWSCTKDDGYNYKVFTSFYKKLINIRSYTPNIPTVSFSNFIRIEKSLDLNDLKLLAPRHSWQGIIDKWEVGESAALSKLQAFLKTSMINYKEARDYPALKATSMLSPHLHFGEISANFIFNEIQKLHAPESSHFIRELIWRDFSYYLMYYYPNIDTQNINEKFDGFEWENKLEILEKWQKGNTGVPIVDAGMRELWQTGYMHNRVRMIVASFLVKNCLVHWEYGEKWFFECLFDADIANNSASWQWVAGCGMDAAPYFRIFNPILQTKKFDPDGNYIRKYVPELERLSDRWIAEPFNAKKETLKAAGIILGVDYPYPIVNLQNSRNKALDRYKNISK